MKSFKCEIMPTQEFISCKEAFEKEVDISKLINNLDLSYQKDRLEIEVFIRYLFSALIDADWLDTEAHFQPDTSQIRPNLTLTADDMIIKLKEELASKSPEGEINKLRNQMRKIALEKSGMQKGFYSLNLPTGMGKTLTSMAWALNHAKANNLKRIIIVLPFISIIDQTAAELKKIFGEEWILEHHSGYNENKDDLSENENELEQRKLLACENWDYPIIVTTSVQFFESIFSNRRSKCRKVHNIAESVVIFDEVQSLPKEITSPTLSMLRNIQTVMGTSFLFCTATQPAFEKRERFKHGIDSIHPLIKNPSEVFKKTQRVEFHLLNELNDMEFYELANIVNGSKGSALIIFNTKKAARIFFDSALKTSNAWHNRYHLSTTMCPAHRKEIISAIREDLEAELKILVSSTQLIEAGVDLDFPCVFREMAPLEGIIQSAGRCNREGKMAELGKVYLFQLKGKSFPDKTYKACAEHAKSLIKEDVNILYSHDSFKKYYSQVVDLFVNPDKNKIIQAQKDFKFKTVGESYHLIEDKGARGVFIYNYSKKSRDLFHSIEHKEFLSRDDYRKMQIYTVQVYQNFLYNNVGSWKEMPQGFLVWDGNYDSNTGISVGPIEQDKLIVSD